MDVVFYHDDTNNRLAYDPQSSPGSVDSISSTDAGPVSAIAALSRDKFGQEFLKPVALKGMNVQVHSGNSSFSPDQQVEYRRASEPIIVSADNYRQTAKTFEEASTASNSYRLSDTTVSTEAGVTPDVISMLKIGGSDFDQMLTHYSGHTGPQMTSQAYPRGLMHEQELYVQNYARELARQRSLGGSNASIAVSNQVGTPPPSAITTTANGASQFEVTDPYFDGRQHHLDDPSTSAFAPPVSTVHYLNEHQQPGHPLLMGHHSLKDEIPQTVPVMPKQSISPINMQEQEIIKTERKRMRNRLAASKCRKRKLERISRLEEKVSNLKQQNLELSSNANLLRQQVADLKTKVMSHVNSGCQLMTSQPQVTF